MSLFDVASKQNEVFFYFYYNLDSMAATIIDIVFMVLMYNYFSLPHHLYSTILFFLFIWYLESGIYSLKSRI